MFVHPLYRLCHKGVSLPLAEAAGEAVAEKEEMEEKEEAVREDQAAGYTDRKDPGY